MEYIFYALLVAVTPLPPWDKMGVVMVAYDKHIYTHPGIKIDKYCMGYSQEDELWLEMFNMAQEYMNDFYIKFCRVHAIRSQWIDVVH